MATRSNTTHRGPVDTPNIDGEEHIRSSKDLPAASGGFHQLEDATLYVLHGTIQSSNGLRHNGSSMVRGNDMRNDIFDYTGTDAAHKVRGDEFFIRDMTTMADSGKAFDLDAQDDETADKDKNDFYATDTAFIMCDDLGTIDGFRVITLKSVALDNWNTGLTLTGDPNKVLVTDSTFRDPDSGATQALLFDTNITVDFVDISGTFFKRFENSVDGINFNGTLGQNGVLQRNLFGTTLNNKTVNFDKGTPGWEFTNNTGIQNSSVRGQLTLDSSTTVTISEQATNKADESAYSQVTGTTSISSITERTSKSGDKIQYDGEKDREVEVKLTASITGVNDTIAITVFKNGSFIDSSSAIRVEGQGNSAVNAITFADADLTKDDTVSAQVANLGSTGNITVEDMVLKVSE